MTGYGAPGRNDPIVTRDRWPGESRTNASATCAIYRVTPGSRDTVAKFDDEASAHAVLVQLQAEQQAIIDAHRVSEQRRVDAGLPAFITQQKEALIAFNIEQRAALDALVAHQVAEREQFKALHPVSTDRYEVVQF